MSTLIIGRNPVIEALKAGRPIEKVLIQRGCHGRPVATIRKLARERGIPVSETDKRAFNELAGTDTAQGVAAIAGQKEYDDLDSLLNRAAADPQVGKNPILIILDGIEDPHNVGALIRTAECAGVNGVILPRHHSAPLTGAAVKASAGAIEYMAIARVANIADTIERLKKEGYWIVGTDGGADTRYDEIGYALPVALVIGAEGKGIRRLVKEKCDYLVRIPLKGKIGSLNASAAGAVIMYEVVRQRAEI
jgi:23S rRNA (guanosine2251-2'-O)-methyltransferase